MKQQIFYVLVTPDGEVLWHTLRLTEVEAFHAYFSKGSNVQATQERGWRVQNVLATLV